MEPDPVRDHDHELKRNYTKRLRGGRFRANGVLLHPLAFVTDLRAGPRAGLRLSVGAAIAHAHGPDSTVARQLLTGFVAKRREVIYAALHRLGTPAA